MGAWSSENTHITEGGTQLLADIAGNTVLTLTRVVAGTDYTDTSELAQMTEVSHVALQMNFSAIGSDDGGNAYVDVYLDNSEVETGFYHQQIGIYAEDTDGEEVLFLIAQADVPDYIPPGTTPIYITHRIYMHFSGDTDIEITANFSGIVTQETLKEEMAKKEDKFDKNSAFNKNFSDTSGDYRTLGRSGYSGDSSSVARADHVHPAGTLLKFAENNWEAAGKTNLLPDTDNWVMSTGTEPDVWGGYSFEATFTGAWQGFSCFFDDDLLATVRGMTIEVGVDYLTGASTRLELVVDDVSVNSLLETETAASFSYTIPEDASSVTLRIIIFSEDDLHCAFSGIYMYDSDEEVSTDDNGAALYLSVRKVLQANLPATGTSGTLYLTELGNLYFASDDGTMLPLAGSAEV